MSPFHFLGPPALDIARRSLSLMGLCEGRYIYVEDLHRLSSSSHSTPSTLVKAQAPPCPINLDRLALYLSEYPGQQLAAYVLSGIRDGFRIGVSGPVSVRSYSQNHPSCLVCPAAVGSYLSLERSAGRMLGPLRRSDQAHISPVGLVPKGHQGDAWSMIVDLSHPSGRSVNHLIPSDLCSLHYPSVDDAGDYILALGRYTQLIKVDLKNAYRILPIHREDRHQLGVCWEGGVYVDLCLPFGLRSAPKIFTAIADPLAWILHHQGVRCLIHYLDDFLIFAFPFTDEGRLFLDMVLGTLADLRVPVARNKLEGPDTMVTFLGILIDTA